MSYIIQPNALDEAIKEHLEHMKYRDDGLMIQHTFDLYSDIYESLYRYLFSKFYNHDEDNEDIEIRIYLEKVNLEKYLSPARLEFLEFFKITRETFFYDMYDMMVSTGWDQSHNEEFMKPIIENYEEFWTNEKFVSKEEEELYEKKSQSARKLRDEWRLVNLHLQRVISILEQSRMDHSSDREKVAQALLDYRIKMREVTNRDDGCADARELLSDFELLLG